MKSLKEQVAELDFSKPKDLDPEALDEAGQDGGPDDSQSGDDDETSATGREHYEQVGRSALRGNEQLELGKQYKGAAVSRSALDTSDEDPFAPIDDEDDVDDPFALRRQSPSEANEESDAAEADSDVHVDLCDGDQDEEIESDEAFGSGDEDKFRDFKFLGSANRSQKGVLTVGQAEESSDEPERDETGSIEEVDFDDNDELDNSLEDESEAETESESAISTFEDDSSATSEPEDRRVEPAGGRDAVRALISNDTAAVASSLSASIASDIKKGQAVKKQHKTFDRLLDARMKLQKGLSIANNLDTITPSDNDVSAAVSKAEDAALKLWSTLESFRRELEAHSAQSNPASKKRKVQMTELSGTSNTELEARMELLESSAVPRRRAILDRWSIKSNSRRLMTATIDSHIATEAEKVAHSSSPTTDDDQVDTATSFPTYDDTFFYQSLLRDLIAHRAVESVMDGVVSDLPPRLHPSNRQLNKKVDTRASKGRKIRYTVHEKLQNFAAPEDRSTWTEAARREFFGSLLGQRALLNEAEDVVMSDDEQATVAEVEALRLFRT